MGRRPYSAKIEQTPLQMMLVDAAKNCGLPAEDLAKKAGVNRSHLYDVLNGWSGGSVGFWQRILDAGDIELGWRHKEEK